MFVRRRSHRVMGASIVVLALLMVVVPAGVATAKTTSGGCAMFASYDAQRVLAEEMET